MWETQQSILTAEERDQHLSKLALDPAVPPATQVSAIKELNKCSGRHSIKHALDVGNAGRYHRRVAKMNNPLAIAYIQRRRAMHQLRAIRTLLATTASTGSRTV